MSRGWFVIPGVQEGDRSTDEQLLGLAPLLGGVFGKTVYDFGCAEGMIAIELVQAGAKSVRGFDNNAVFLHTAHQLRAGLNASQHGRLAFDYCDLREVEGIAALPPRDIVLALAILHKLRDPEGATRAMAAVAKERLVVRLPQGSEGLIKWKHGNARCDLRDVLPDCGLRLDQVLPGPRSELVQHWTRT